MEKFEKLTAVAAPMPASNIDTDIIMPKAFLKRIDKEGVLEGLFHDVRLYEDGREREGFVLNQPEYRSAKILVTGSNFGCGSSREHAVWGLEKRGIKCLIGSSFAGIFFDNCANNGVLAIVLPKETVSALIQEVQNSESKNVTVDLEAQTVTTPSGAILHFEIEPSRKEKLLQGLDPVALTLKSEEKIKNFDGVVLFTRDTHETYYLDTQEGKKLPVPHCIRDTEGWQIRSELDALRKTEPIDKETFGSTDLAGELVAMNEDNEIESITFVGLCTDICVISNALLAKASLPEVPIIVDAKCCAGVTPESHENALKAMEVCQIQIDR